MGNPTSIQQLKYKASLHLKIAKNGRTLISTGEKFDFAKYEIKKCESMKCEIKKCEQKIQEETNPG